MSASIYSIVEGHGEVAAVPILLRRISSEFLGHHDVRILKPHRLQRGKILAAAQDLQKAVELGKLKLAESANGIILLLLDADDDCPARVAPALLEKIRRPGLRTSVVLAKREFEAWFLAGARSLRGHPRVSDAAEAPDDPELIRGAKEFLKRKILSQPVYSETVDQPSLVTHLDLAEARASPSFDKLCRDLSVMLSDSGLGQR
jgi:hypothetical protein